MSELDVCYRIDQHRPEGHEEAHLYHATQFTLRPRPV
jgi:hypothetical protein